MNGVACRTPGGVDLLSDVSFRVGDGEHVALTPTEYRLLEILATSGGRLCTSRFLSERLWGPGSELKGRSLVDHVASLRRKLDDPSVPELLVTEPGIGYRFVVPA